MTDCIGLKRSHAKGGTWRSKYHELNLYKDNVLGSGVNSILICLLVMLKEMAGSREMDMHIISIFMGIHARLSTDQGMRCGLRTKGTKDRTLGESRIVGDT